MTENEKLAIKEFTNNLHQMHPNYIEKIILFGSKARGDDKEGSDTDILVIIKNASIELKNTITDMAYDIILKYGVNIETIIFNSEEWSKFTKNPTSFAYCVLNEGKEL